MDHTGVHLEITLTLKIDWPQTTAAEFIEIMDRRYHLDSLDMGDAAGALVKAFVEGDFVFAMETDQVFDWTGTSKEALETGLRYNSVKNAYEAVSLKPQVI